MKYISYMRDGLISCGFSSDCRIFDIPNAARSFGNTTIPETLPEFVARFDDFHPIAVDMFESTTPARRPELYFPAGQATLLPPIPAPPSVTVYRLPEMPISNEGTSASDSTQMLSPALLFKLESPELISPGDTLKAPEETQLTFDYAIAAIIWKPGEDLSAEDAITHIVGLSLLTWVHLSDANSECSAISVGPWLVTIDEFDPDGNSFDVNVMINNLSISNGNWGNLLQTLPKIIAETSKDGKLHSGEVLAFSPAQSAEESRRILHPGDRVTVAADGLGRLGNTIQ
ncbi:MAG: fumarylacetoacetate hydrolase family protein [Candidatus Marinimicrobia bacterium]|nr:fumarylacetoacetate hydrolase family protein [Candidatus Neomarinimicrobiota bacterium]MCF7828066.1 fumarylacetoacetate hydrolase family protein [Candidatus Neomarinimicrobiota bacterium]MCF7879759.1 fumarylacetoacetate hydrolase family protein [Candidatus Neomarinimicrobiota bacterium]